MLFRSVVSIQRYARGYFSRTWCSHMQHAAVFIQKFVRKLLVRVVLDKPGRFAMRKYQKALNRVLQTEGITESDQFAQCCALKGKMILEMDRHRQHNVELRRALSSNLRSKHTRKENREKMMVNVGRVQPQRGSIFEPMVVRSKSDASRNRYHCQQTRVFKLIHNSKEIMNCTLAQRDEFYGLNSWTCMRRITDPGVGEEFICKQTNLPGVVFCMGCGRKQYGRQHAAAALGEAALVAIRKAKGSSKAACKKREIRQSVTLAARSWGRRVFQVGHHSES